MRQKIVAGNWKMNKDWEAGKTLVSQILELLSPREESGVTAILAPPFPYLQYMATLVSKHPGVKVAAQNSHQESSGAYTGEVSAGMLRSIGVSHVILGHSERREYFKESNELLARKVDQALLEDLTPIFCCGEPLSIRESNDHMEYVCHQISASLFHLKEESLRGLVLAYEPIWAIGTGKTASSQQAQEMHQSIRKYLAENFGQEIADVIPILYGGSCKPGNADEIFAGPDVDGGLIGGASLNANDFVAIIKSLQNHG